MNLCRRRPASQDGNKKYIIINVLLDNWDAYAWTKDEIDRIPEMLDGKISVAGSQAP